eukprot:Lankesteria_metandrocarpae@DN5341_c0_g1_i2.p2
MKQFSLLAFVVISCLKCSSGQEPLKNAEALPLNWTDGCMYYAHTEPAYWYKTYESFTLVPTTTFKGGVPVYQGLDAGCVPVNRYMYLSNGGYVLTLNVGEENQFDGVYPKDSAYPKDFKPCESDAFMTHSGLQWTLEKTTKSKCKPKTL